MSEWQNLRRGLVALGLLAGLFGVALLAHPPPVALTWSYPKPMPATNYGQAVGFEVWRSADLKTWTVLERTNQPPLPLSTMARQTFYKMREFQVGGGATNYGRWSTNLGMLFLPHPPFLSLTWDYPQPMPATNNGVAVGFEIWRSSNLKTWWLLARTNQPPLKLTTVPERMFYKIRAFEVYDGITNYSLWATK